jgi:hypothetical protein
MWNLKDRNKVIGTQDKVLYPINSGQYVQKAPAGHVPDQASDQDRITVATLLFPVQVQQQIPQMYSFNELSQHDGTAAIKLKPDRALDEHF